MNEGGPAYPRTGFLSEDGLQQHDTEPQDGMSLLDWFAGMATDDDLKSIIADSECGNRPPCSRSVARFRHAAAMVAESDKGRAVDAPAESKT